MDIKTEVQEKSKEKTSLDALYAQELGQFGKYQFLFVPIMCMAMGLGYVYNDYVFTVARIPHRCMIEECLETSDAPFSPDWLINAVPYKDGSPASCDQYQPLGNGSLDYCPAELFDNSTTIECKRHVYETKSTAVYDFDLGCDEWLRSIVGSISNIGAFLSMPISGYISDKYGRRVVLIGSIMCIEVFGILKSFSVKYPMYIVLVLLQTSFGFGYTGASHIFVSETVGPNYRVLVNSLCSVFTAIGQMWMAFVAWKFQDSWRMFLLVLHVPYLLYGLFYFVLPESIRWLFSKKKFDELKMEMERIARTNGRTLNEKTLENFFREHEMEDIKIEDDRPKPNVLKSVLKSPIMRRRVIIISICWMASVLINYGISINSVNLSGNKYLNYALTGMVKIPGYLIITLFSNIGRRTKLAFCYIVAAFCNAAYVCLPSDMVALSTTSYLLGQTAISSAVTTVYVYTVELYPTEFRHNLFSFSSMIGRIGSTLAPLTPALSIYWAGAPSTIFAICGFCACLLVLLLPETLGKKMPETMKEAEELEKK